MLATIPASKIKFKAVPKPNNLRYKNITKLKLISKVRLRFCKTAPMIKKKARKRGIKKVK